MCPKIDEDKKSELLNIVTALEEEFMAFMSKMENDNDNISDEDWEKYESAAERIYRLLQTIRQDIYFT